MAAKKLTRSGPKARAAFVREARNNAVNRRAEEIAQAAIAQGITAPELRGKNLTGQQTALRDSLIVARREQGWTTAMIAREAGVTERTVRSAVQRMREQPSLAAETIDPRTMIADIERQLKRSASEWDVLAFHYVDSNPSAAIGAKKQADELRGELLVLYDRMGVLPEDWLNLKQNDELQRLGDALGKFITLVEADKLNPAEIRGFLVREGLMSPERIEPPEIES